jgi:hypothetical protein
VRPVFQPFFFGLCPSLPRQVLGRFLAFGFLKKFELSPRKTATLEEMIKKEFFKTNPQHFICEIQLHSNLYFPLFLALLK